jgi:hypothetical protein
MHLIAGAPGCNENHILHRVINEMFPIFATLYCPILVKFVVGDFHVMLLSMCAMEAMLFAGA